MTARIYDLYPMQIEAVKDQYNDRIFSIMNQMREALTSAGHFVTEVDFWDYSDNYEWHFCVARNEAELDRTYPDEPDIIDINFTIPESVTYGDDDDGISFRLDVTHYGGAIIGGLSPYNYTPQCWVDINDPEAVEERFLIMENADHYSVVDLIEEWWDKYEVD